MRKRSSDLKAKLAIGGIATLFVLLVSCFLLFCSWGIICLLIKAICFCFSLEFNLLVATGIWLILCIFRSILHQNKSNKE